MVHEAELRHILIVEGDERPVRVGAGDGPCATLCVAPPQDGRHRPGPLPE